MINKIKNFAYKLLKKSEQYLKTDMIYLAKGGFWLTLGQMISSLSSFLLAIAFANLLPQETYGLYKYILSLAGILSIPTLQGMNTAITQAVARNHDGSLKLAVKTRIKWGTLGAVASLILSGYYYFFGNTILSISFLIACIFLPIMDSFSSYDSFLQGKKLFKVSTKYNIITQIITVTLLIGVIFFTKNLYLIVFTYFFSWTLLRFIFLKISLKKYVENQNIDSKTITYGKHLSLISILSTTANQIDKILIFHFLGAVQLAVYTFATVATEQLKGLLKSVQSLLLPKYSIQNITQIKENIYKKMLMVGFFVGILIFLYIIFAPLIFQIIFPKYISAVFYSQIYSISLITIISMFPITALNSQMAKKNLYKLNIVSPIIQIILLVILTYYFGLLGAIISRILFRFFVLFYSMFLLFNTKS